MARFPDFLCVGQQKAGTTWLWKNLRAHPQVYLPFVKEIDYFNDLYIPESRAWISRTRRLQEFLGYRDRVADKDAQAFKELVAHARFAPNDVWYAEQFEDAGARIAGDLTPGYALLPPQGLWHVRRLNPEVKIILMVRDPAERAWSAARHYLRRVSKDPEETDLVAFIEEHPDILKNSDAAAILASWRRIFSEDQIFVHFFDDVAERPEALLAEVCDQIGVDPGYEFPAAHEPVFPGIEVETPAAVSEYLAEALAPAYARLEAAFPERHFAPKGV
ncbi:MAG: sulfotransferase [Pseudomonadota bacterium]